MTATAKTNPTPTTNPSFESVAIIGPPRESRPGEPFRRSVLSQRSPAGQAAPPGAPRPGREPPVWTMLSAGGPARPVSEASAVIPLRTADGSTPARADVPVEPDEVAAQAELPGLCCRRRLTPPLHPD